MNLYPKFAVVPTGAQLDWFKSQMCKQEQIIIEQRKQNPLIALYGPGPEDARCRTCIYLRCNQCSKRYYKCALRRITNGKATDHKVSWSACGKYVKAMI